MRFEKYLEEVLLYRGGKVFKDGLLVWYSTSKKQCDEYSKNKSDYIKYVHDVDVKDMNIIYLGSESKKLTYIELFDKLKKHTKDKDQLIKLDAYEKEFVLRFNGKKKTSSLIFDDKEFIDVLNFLNVDGISLVEDGILTYGFLKQLQE